MKKAKVNGPHELKMMVDNRLGFHKRRNKMILRAARMNGYIDQRWYLPIWGRWATAFMMWLGTMQMMRKEQDARKQIQAMLRRRERDVLHR